MLRTRSSDGTTAVRALSRSSSCRLQRPYSTRCAGVTSHIETGSRGNHAPPTSENASTVETHAPVSGRGQTRVQSSLNSPPPIDVEALRSRLKEWSVLTRSSLRRSAGEFSSKATTTFSQLGAHLNRATGYEEIEVLKGQVVEREARIKATRLAARAAKTAYDEAVLQRSVSQRQVNDLLQRKSGWTDTDVSNFTLLVRSDHSFEQEEARAKARVTETEDAVDREFSELMRVILARYHEEQVWSDKIRSASTYGSLAVLGVNLAVFIVAIIVVEPWKRKKLAQTFEKKVEEMGAETKALMNASAARLEERLTGHEKLLTGMITQVSTEARQGIYTAAAAPEGGYSEETPAIPSPRPSWWSRVYVSYPHPGHELMLIAGSAAVGSVITIVTRSLFFS